MKIVSTHNTITCYVGCWAVTSVGNSIRAAWTDTRMLQIRLRSNPEVSRAVRIHILRLRDY